MRVLVVGLLLLFIYASPTTSRADDVDDCLHRRGDIQIRGCSRIIKSGKLFGKPISKSNLATAYNNRGIAYRKKDEYDSAIADYTKAIALDPKLGQAYYNRGLAYKKKGDKEQAIADFRKALEIDPSDQDAKDDLELLRVTP